MSEKARDGRQRRASEGKGATPVGRVGARAHSKPAGRKKRDVAVACAYRLGSASFRCVAPPNRASQTRQPGSIPENTRKCSSSSPLERERERARINKRAREGRWFHRKRVERERAGLPGE